MAKWLVIEIPMESNDIDEDDFETLVAESKDAVGINIMVGRPLMEDPNNVCRTFEFTAEDFSARIEER